NKKSSAHKIRRFTEEARASDVQLTLVDDDQLQLVQQSGRNVLFFEGSVLERLTDAAVCMVSALNVGGFEYEVMHHLERAGVRVVNSAWPRVLSNDKFWTQ